MANNVEINLKAKTTDFETGLAKAGAVIDNFAKKGGDLNKAITGSFSEINKAAKQNLDTMQQEMAKFNVKSDLKINFEMKNVEQTKTAITAVFNKIAEGSVSVDEATAAINRLNMSLANVDANRSRGQFKDLGIMSEASIEAMKAKTISAYEEIRRIGTSTPNDIIRAEEAMSAKLAELDALKITGAEKVAAEKYEIAFKELQAEEKMLEQAFLLNQKFDYDKIRSAEKVAAEQARVWKEAQANMNVGHASQSMSGAGSAAQLIGQSSAGSAFGSDLKSQMEAQAAVQAGYAASAMQGEQAAARLAGQVHAGSDFTAQMKSQMEGVNEVAGKVHEGISGWSLASVVAIAKIQVLYSIINTVMSAVSELPTMLMTSVESYRSAIIQNAATITSMEEGVKDVGLAYLQNKEYAHAVQDELVKMSSTTIASATQLQMLNNEFIRQGVYLDTNNAKAVQGFKNVANAVSVISAGMENKNIQFSEQIRQVLEGVARPNAQLLRTLMAIDPMIREHIQLWREEGTTIEHMGGLLTGFAAATGDIGSLWETVKTTMVSIRDQILRGGFADGFKDIVNASKELNKYLEENKDKIQQMMKGAFKDMEFAVKTMWNFRDEIKMLGEVALWSGIVLGIASVEKAFVALNNVVKTSALLKLINNPVSLAIVGAVLGGAAVVSKAHDNQDLNAEAADVKNLISSNKNLSLIQKANLMQSTASLNGTNMEAFHAAYPNKDNKWLADMFANNAVSMTGGDAAGGATAMALKFNTDKIKWITDTQGAGILAPKDKAGLQEPDKEDHTAYNNAYVSYSHAFDEHVAHDHILANNNLLEANQLAYDKGLVDLKDYLSKRNVLMEANLITELNAKKSELAEITKNLNHPERIEKTDKNGIVSEDMEREASVRYELMAKQQKALTAVTEAQDKYNKAVAAEPKFASDEARKIADFMLKAQSMVDKIDKSIASEAMNKVAELQNSVDYNKLSPGQRNTFDNNLVGNVQGAIDKEDAQKAITARNLKLEEIQNDLMIIDMQEKMNEMTGPDALQKRLTLEQQLTENQKNYLDSLDKNKDAGTWFKQNMIYMQAMAKSAADMKKVFDATPMGGFTDALKKYAEGATNLGAQVSSITTQIFKGMEDALVKFVETGKLNFKSLADSIIQDMIRMMIQQGITGPLAAAFGTPGAAGAAGIGWLGSLFNNSGSSSAVSSGAGPLASGYSGDTGGSVAASFMGTLISGAFAGGGTALGGNTYLVGENGPELFTPGATGVVTPNSALGGSNDMHMNVSIDARGADAGVEARINSAMNQAVQQAQAAVLSNMRRGGTMARATGVRN